MVSLARKLTAAAVLATSFTAPAWAQTLSPQMQLLNECNIKASAQGYAGQARKSYVSACVSGQKATPVAKALNATQQKTSACEDQANTQRLGGEARQTFLKSCLR